MLINTNQSLQKNYSRRTGGAGRESDIWSAGCTLYEILTGDFLFYDVDWIRFFLHITIPCAQESYAKDSETFKDLPAVASLKRGIKLIPEKRAMLGNSVYLIDLLEFILVQDS